MNLHEKIYNVMCDSQALEKDLTVGEGRNSYQAVGEKAVLNMLKPLFKKYKLVIFPIDGEITETNFSWEVEYNGKAQTKVRNVTQVKVLYKLVDVESGESVTIAGFGNGADSQDKGSGKALTYAYKTALSKTFMLFSGEDTDNEHSDDLGLNNLTGLPETNFEEEYYTNENIHYCEDCDREITATAKSSVETLLKKGQKYYHGNFCGPCMNKRYKAEHPDA